METGLVKTENTAVVAPPLGAAEITNIEGLDFSDCQPTRLMLQQKMSKMVDDGKTKPGDIVDSVSGEIKGSESKPISLIPLSVYKEWAHFYTDEKPAKFFGRTPYSPANAGWEYEGVSGDVPPRPIMNQICMIWSLLPIGGGMPVLVNFRSSSYKAGKTLASLVMQNAVAKKRKTIELSCEKQSNEKGTFFVFKVKDGRDLTPQEIAEADRWKKLISKKPLAPQEPETLNSDEQVPF